MNGFQVIQILYCGFFKIKFYSSAIWLSLTFCLDGLDEAQTRIKIARRNINNLKYAEDTTLMAESKEELKSFLMEVKDKSEKFDLKLNIQKTKIMASSPIISWQIDGETMETVIYAWINNKVLLDSTGNCIQYSRLNHNGKECKKRMFKRCYGECK